MPVDYRLAPEHPFPQPLEDVISAYLHLLESYSAEQIVVMGDSAGGGLAISLVLWLRENDRPMPRAVVGLSPWLDLTHSQPSFRLNEQDYLPADSRDPAWIRPGRRSHYYVAHDSQLTHALVSPLFARDVAGRPLPPMLLHVGEQERLRDETLHFALHTVRSSPVAVEMFEDQVHVFQAFAGLGERAAAQSLERIGRFVREGELPRADGADDGAGAEQRARATFTRTSGPQPANQEAAAQGLGVGGRTALIVVGIMVVLAGIGVYIFRKMSLRPSAQFKDRIRSGPLDLDAPTFPSRQVQHRSSLLGPLKDDSSVPPTPISSVGSQIPQPMPPASSAAPIYMVVPVSGVSQAPVEEWQMHPMVSAAPPLPAQQQQPQHMGYEEVVYAPSFGDPAADLSFQQQAAAAYASLQQQQQHQHQQMLMFQQQIQQQQHQSYVAPYDDAYAETYEPTDTSRLIGGPSAGGQAPAAYHPASQPPPAPGPGFA
ncbi:hypothetical protein HK105_202532 [Polyrhizophydium stewartii]|uniref:Alpha/beta hydrolase fold-3 domain-containing protein n=1 Tax=Polyrhizophydium stewartii TaxID=2732419 RepID=A0ABR4NF10_9FUNG